MSSSALVLILLSAEKLEVTVSSQVGGARTVSSTPRVRFQWGLHSSRREAPRWRLSSHWIHRLTVSSPTTPIFKSPDDSISQSWNVNRIGVSSSNHSRLARSDCYQRC